MEQRKREGKLEPGNRVGPQWRVKWSEEQGSTQLKWEGKQETEEGRREGVKIRKEKANRDKQRERGRRKEARGLVTFA